MLMDVMNVSCRCPGSDATSASATEGVGIGAAQSVVWLEYCQSCCSLSLCGRQAFFGHSIRGVWQV